MEISNPLTDTQPNSELSIQNAEENLQDIIGMEKEHSTSAFYSSLLCKDCRGITLESLLSLPNNGHSFHSRWEEVQECAKTVGCPLCAFLCRPSIGIMRNGTLYPVGSFNNADQLSEDTKKRIREFEPGKLYVLSELGGKGLVVMINEEERLFRYWSLSVGDSHEAKDVSERYKIPVRRPLTTTGSESSLSTARQWLSRCDAEHCCFPSESAPSRCPAARLIDVRAFGLTSKDVRLVMTNNAVDTGKYLALSYRWGKQENAFISTGDNLHSHTTHIQFSSLPLTFQHVVHVARFLDIRYVWIDALCIVQDDPRDWDDQAGKMCAVYAGATLVVAADSGSDPSTGLFNEQSVLFDEEPLGTHVAVSVPHVPHGEAGAVLYVSTNEAFPSSLKTENGDVAMGDDQEEENLDRMLVTRGWTLQEAVLAPRVLHFTSVQLVWECAACGYVGEDESSVLLRDQRPTYVEVKDRLRVISENRKPSDEIFEVKKREGIYEADISTDESGLGMVGRGPIKATSEELAMLNAWYFDLILLRYSTRNLSYETDRLPAIAALAEWTAETLCCEYVAGMWRTGLEWALTWRKARPERRKGWSVESLNGIASDAVTGASVSESVEPNHPCYDAASTIGHHGPTFSWISTTGPVHWDYAISTFVPSITITRLDVQLAGSSPFGRIHAGFDSGTQLRIKGLVARNAILRPERSTSAYKLPGDVLCSAWMDHEEDVEGIREGEVKIKVSLLELGVAAGPPDAAGGGQWWIEQDLPRNVCVLLLEELERVGDESVYLRKGMAEFNWDPESVRKFRKDMRWESLTLL